jgi:rhodanese-related sulfurtransferase
MTPALTRRERTREQDPTSVPQPLPGEADLVVVDTTWGELQPLVVAAGVQTVGELEVIALARHGATLVDCRTPGSFFGATIAGSVLIPHDEIVDRRAELDPDGTAVLFCNGPQCPQSPDAIRRLLAAGVPASALAYYRGGMQDWVCAALPTQPQAD